MFEKPASSPSKPTVRAGENSPASVVAPEGDPVEFIYNGRHFHIHAIHSKWKESGGWWNRIDDGSNHLAEEETFDDGARDVWRVEAAPEGALTTFEIERDKVTKNWRIHPTSRPL